MLKFWKLLNEIYRRLLTAVLWLVLLVGIWQLYDNWYTLSHTLDERITRYKPGSDGLTAEDTPISDEMVGWITIDGTGIDYPVMQGRDNSRFLNTDPFGNYSVSGSIFLDSRSSPDFSDSFMLIYGHHMDYGKMFGSLDDFLNPGFLGSHSTGTLMIGRNAEKVCKLRVFAAMKVSSREKTVFDMDSEHIEAFIKENADVYTPRSSGRIIGLATCAGAASQSRTVVFCRIEE